VEKALVYHQSWAGLKPNVTILVLASSDWNNYTKFPVYGMPHYNDDKTLVVAAEDNPFWKSFLPPLEMLPGELQKEISSVYRSKDGNVSMEAFFDLLALHELGHAFHLQGKLNMQRKWMGELFSNILLHTYIAENEQASLPALTLFPRMVISNGVAEYKYTSLVDIEDHYEEIGMNHPKNYGWFQSRWHSAAKTIYEVEGKEVCRKLWNVLSTQKERLGDEELLSLFEANGLRSLAAMVRNWDEETKASNKR
jgi:hypothetical protein